MKVSPIDMRWILITVVVVLGIGIGAIMVALLNGQSDAAVLGIIVGLIAPVLTGLVALLQGTKNSEKLDEISHSVNGKLQARLDAQDTQIAEIKSAVTTNPPGVA